MGIRQEELIDRYFEHGMTSGEETNFLITLAASDEMRIAFRSQLELMKAVRDDKDLLRSGGASAGAYAGAIRTGSGMAEVRNRTLTALGLSAAAVTPFLEQELMRNAKTESARQEAASVAPVPAASGLVNGLLRTPKYALATGVLLGFLGSIALMNVWSGIPAAGPHAALPNATLPHAAVPGSTAPNAAAPQTTLSHQGTNAPSQLRTANDGATHAVETIPAANSLNTKVGSTSAPLHDVSPAARPASPEGVIGHDRTADHTSGATPAKAPEVSVNGRGRIGVHPSIIKSASDTAK